MNQTQLGVLASILALVFMCYGIAMMADGPRLANKVIRTITRGFVNFFRRLFGYGLIAIGRVLIAMGQELQHHGRRLMP